MITYLVQKSVFVQSLLRCSSAAIDAQQQGSPCSQSICSVQQTSYLPAAPSRILIRNPYFSFQRKREIETGIQVPNIQPDTDFQFFRCWKNRKHTQRWWKVQRIKQFNDSYLLQTLQRLSVNRQLDFPFLQTETKKSSLCKSSVYLTQETMFKRFAQFTDP